MSIDCKVIGNEPFSLSYLSFDEASYEDSLRQKIAATTQLFLDDPEIKRAYENLFSPVDVICSPVKHSRQRCRFAIRSCADFGCSCALGKHYVLWENGQPSVKVQAFPIASIQITDAMTPLLECLCNYSECSLHLDAVHFLSTSSGELLITLVYGSPLAEGQWLTAANALLNDLLAYHFQSIRSISLLGRSKGKKIHLGSDHVIEKLTLADKRVLLYKQIADSFSNPNSAVNTLVLDWLRESVLEHSIGYTTDLLEMYCGNGNHTVALSGD